MRCSARVAGVAAARAHRPGTRRRAALAPPRDAAAPPAEREGAPRRQAARTCGRSALVVGGRAVNTIDLAGLPPGPHKIPMELLNRNHEVFPYSQRRWRSLEEGGYKRRGQGACEVRLRDPYAHVCRRTLRQGRTCFLRLPPRSRGDQGARGRGSPEAAPHPRGPRHWLERRRHRRARRPAHQGRRRLDACWLSPSHRRKIGA